MTARTASCFKAFVRVACAAHVLACLDMGEPDHPRPNGGPLVSSSTSPVGADALLPSHLPCEIERLLRERCKSCHSPLSPLHLTSLLTREELLQPSRSLPGFNYAQQAQQLIQSGMMPPTSSLVPADVQRFSAWVQAGAPAADCTPGALDAGLDASIVFPFDAGIPQGGGDATTYDASPPLVDAGDASVDAGDPFGTPTRCTSGQHWLGGDMRSELMHPGRACIACHTTGAGLFNLLHGPTFTFAGTVFPSAHEPDDCNGAPGSGVSIVVKGANGQTVTVSPNAAGNFRSMTRVTTPYTAEVHYQGRVRVMTTPQTSGDCNSCHSERGANGAPGRIALP